MELPADPPKFLTLCLGLMVVLTYFALSGMLSLPPVLSDLSCPAGILCP